MSSALLHGLSVMENKTDAVYYISHSGGKDSQAMYLTLCRHIAHDRIVVVHADLGEVEWEGVQDHIRATIDHPLNVVRAGKSFFEMVRHRAKARPDVPAWPSPNTRQCTSDLKRGPIRKFIRADLASKGKKVGVNCMGIRAEESPARSRQAVWEQNTALSVAGRSVYEWRPIHDWPIHRVFAAIAEARQKPFWAYRENKRLSCMFCIMGCQNDLRHAARVRPDLYRKYLELEAETGWTMFHGASLRDRVEAKIDDGPMLPGLECAL